VLDRDIAIGLGKDRQCRLDYGHLLDRARRSCSFARR
jgi:hypothetical protein